MTVPVQNPFENNFESLIRQSLPKNNLWSEVSTTTARRIREEMDSYEITSYLSSREGMIIVSLSIATIACIILAPGIYSYYIAGSETINASLLNRIISVIRRSAAFWKTQIVSYPITSLSGLGLYTSLIMGESTKSYSAWRISRQQQIHENQQIPEEYQDDPELRKNTCPITHSAVRYPVKCTCEPRHIFEEAALKAWLKSKTTCPVSRKVLRIDEVIFDKKLASKISKRLTELNQKGSEVN